MSPDQFNDLTGYLFRQDLDLVLRETHSSFIGKGASVAVFPQKIGFVFTGRAIPHFGATLLRGVYPHVPGFERLDEDVPGTIEELCTQFPFLHELR